MATLMSTDNEQPWPLQHGLWLWRRLHWCGAWEIRMAGDVMRGYGGEIKRHVSTILPSDTDRPAGVRRLDLLGGLLP